MECSEMSMPLSQLCLLCCPRFTQKRWEWSASMSDFDLVLRGNIVTSDSILEDGYVAVSGEKIAAVGQGTPPAAREIQDFSGHWIIPGVIDGQVHSGSQADQEGIGMCSRAAAAGGVTVMVDMPYDDPRPVTDSTLFNQKVDVVNRE